MKYFFGTFIIFLLVAVPLSASTRLTEVNTFGFFLGVEDSQESLDALSSYDLVVVDGENFSQESVHYLQAQGVLVLGYISVGTIERQRPWTKRLKEYAAGYWEDWDEWYADTNNREFRRIVLRKVVRRVVKKNFDGLFLDNTDTPELYPEMRRGMYRLVKRISRFLHDRDKLVFSQNGRSLLPAYAPYLDGWNMEDVSSTYDFESSSYRDLSNEEREENLRFFAEAKELGLFVLGTDYIDEGNLERRHESFQDICSAGALPCIADIFLTEIPEAEGCF